MKYTKTKPTVSGFYWARFEGNEAVVYVFEDKIFGGLSFWTVTGADLPVSEAPEDFEWAGPLPKPQD